MGMLVEVMAVADNLILRVNNGREIMQLYIAL